MSRVTVFFGGTRHKMDRRAARFGRTCHQIINSRPILPRQGASACVARTACSPTSPRPVGCACDHVAHGIADSSIPSCELYCSRPLSDSVSHRRWL